MSNSCSSLLCRATHFLRKSPEPNPRFLNLLNRRNLNSNSLKTRTFFLSNMSQSAVGFSSSAATGPLSSNGGDAEHRVDHFSLSSSSALKIQKGDITQWSVDGASDAIVNAANEQMLGGGGVDGAIHRAAGPELRAACYAVPQVRPTIRCPTGEARITRAFKLPVAHVIHTVGPIYEAHEHPEILLSNSYRNSLKLAKENNIQYVAFPAISCGVYGYPFDEAATIAISTIKEFATDFKEVHFVLFSDDIYKVWLEKANELL